MIPKVSCVSLIFSSLAPRLLGAYIFATLVDQRIVRRPQEIIFIPPISQIATFSSQKSTLLLTEERKRKKNKNKKQKNKKKTKNGKKKNSSIYVQL